VRNSRGPDDIVLDPCGSGSTLIARERLGRRARLVELDPAYVDVIIQRWQALTGGSAALAPQDARGSFEDPAERTENVMPA
jgi:DNA modification methylase